MTAFPRVANYPDFVSNQVLTAQLLNNLRTYLDEQNRLALLRGTGRGIVCGLTVTLGANEVAITDGFGITSEGYLIELKGDTATHVSTYTHFKAYKEPVYEALKTNVQRDIDLTDFKYDLWQIQPAPAPPASQQIELWELLPTPPTTAPIPAGVQALDTTNLAAWNTDYVVVLYLEFNPTKLRSCVSSDCNNKGWEIDLSVKPLLVKKTALTALTQVDNCTPKPTIRMPRLHSAWRGLNPAAPFASVTSAAVLMGGFQQLINAMVPVLDENVAALFTQLKSSFDLGNAPVSIGTQLAAINLAATDSRLQCVYDFLKDVTDAYNEIWAAACPFIDCLCYAEGDFVRHLFLGALDGTEDYRHLFEPSPALSARPGEVKTVKKLMARLSQLIATFDPNRLDAVPLKISPSQTEDRPLGQRAVGFYYDPATIKEVWQPENCCLNDDLTGYHFQDYPTAPAGSGWDQDFDWNYGKTNFFRIEGHLQQSSAAVESTLQALQHQHNVEFKVLTLPLQSAANGGSELFPIEEIRKIRFELNHELAKQGLRQYDFLQGEILVMKFPDYDAAFNELVLPALNLEDGIWHKILDEWQTGRCALVPSCNITFLQSDYLILRGEFLSHFKHLRGVFEPLMDSYEMTYRDTQPPLSKLEVGTLTQLRLFRLYLNWLAERLMPKDVTVFCYPLFIEVFKEWHRVAYEARAVIGGAFSIDQLKDQVRHLIPGAGFPNNKLNFNFLPENFQDRLNHYLDKSTNGNFNGNLENASAAFVILADIIDKMVAGLSDAFAWINTYFEHKTQQQLATVYYSLEQILSNKAQTFSEFAAQNPGLEHISGVEKGGTFVLVADDQDQVVADFALSGQVENCCCEFDPDALSLPPVATTDVAFVIAELRGEGEKRTLTVEETVIPLLPNDYGLNTPSSPCRPSSETLTLEEPEFMSEQDGKLSLSPDGSAFMYSISLSKQVQLTNSLPVDADFISIDVFDYNLLNDSGMSDVGRVIVVLIPRSVFDVQREMNPGNAIVTVIVTGRVTRQGVAGAAGVNVTVKGTNSGTITANEGSFRMSVSLPANSIQTLVVNIVGAVAHSIDFNVPSADNQVVNVGAINL